MLDKTNICILEKTYVYVYLTVKSPDINERRYFAKAVHLIFETVRRFLFEILLSRKGTIKDIEITLMTKTWNVALEKHIKGCILGSGEKLTERDFDINIIYYIIRNAKILDPCDEPTKGYGKEPSAYDVRLGDDIERCRLLRNKLCHSTAASMTENDFITMVKEVKDILHRWYNEIKGGMELVREAEKVANSSFTIRDVNVTVKKFITDIKFAAQLGTCEKTEIMQSIQIMVCLLIKLGRGDKTQDLQSDGLFACVRIPSCARFVHFIILVCFAILSVRLSPYKRNLK